MDALEIVKSFIGAWNRLDMDTVYAMMAEDIVWDNIPVGPVHGVEGCKELMKAFSFDQAEFVLHNIVADGNIVMTERTDRFLMGGKWRAIRLMGIFEVNAEGKIQHWRDYFDNAEFEREFA